MIRTAENDATCTVGNHSKKQSGKPKKQAKRKNKKIRESKNRARNLPQKRIWLPDVLDRFAGWLAETIISRSENETQKVKKQFPRNEGTLRIVCLILINDKAVKLVPDLFQNQAFPLMIFSHYLPKSTLAY